MPGMIGYLQAKDARNPGWQRLMLKVSVLGQLRMLDIQGKMLQAQCFPANPWNTEENPSHSASISTTFNIKGNLCYIMPNYSLVCLLFYYHFCRHIPRKHGCQILVW